MRRTCRSRIFDSLKRYMTTTDDTVKQKPNSDLINKFSTEEKDQILKNLNNMKKNELNRLEFMNPVFSNELINYRKSLDGRKFSSLDQLNGINPNFLPYSKSWK
jgi:hypothetical protein